jgi:hypothetical protein
MYEHNTDMLAAMKLPNNGYANVAHAMVQELLVNSTFTDMKEFFCRKLSLWEMKSWVRQ